MHPGKKPARIFEELFESAASYWNKHNLQLDPFLPDKAKDGRFGLSLIARPGEELREKFAEIQNALSGIFGSQYDYPSGDFHLTVLTLVSCVDGFRLEPAEKEKYIRCVHPVLSGERPFRLGFRGIGASADSIFFKVADGYTRLDNVRARLRRAVVESGLDATMDKRHRLAAGHVTGIRFVNESHRLPELLDFIKANAGRKMGSMEVGNIELVNNDWFMTAAKTKVLRDFRLGDRGA